MEDLETMKQLGIRASVGVWHIFLPDMLGWTVLNQLKLDPATRHIPVQIVTLDASFISLRLLLPAVVGWLAPGADIIPLVKPQFEAERERVGLGAGVGIPAGGNAGGNPR